MLKKVRVYAYEKKGDKGRKREIEITRKVNGSFIVMGDTKAKESAAKENETKVALINDIDKKKSYKENESIFKYPVYSTSQ